MSASPDPQTWIFPPLGASSLPSDPSAAFGPISRGDKIKLQWAPADQTPDVHMICANDGTTFTISEGNPSPFTYTFTQSVNNGSSHMCWMFFPGTSVGNTVTFLYRNSGTGSSVTWQQNSQLAEALAGTGPASTVTVTASDSNGNGNGASPSTVTTTVTALQTTYLTTISDASTTYVSTGVSVLAAASGSASAIANPQSSGLSAGAAAGIAVAATVAFVLLCLLGFCVFRRIRRDRNEGSSSSAHQPHALPPNMSTSAAGPGQHHYAGMGAGGIGRPPVPDDHKYTQPQMLPNQSQGYYGPDQFRNGGIPGAGQGQGMGRQGPLPAVPRRTIHEVEG